MSKTRTIVVAALIAVASVIAVLSAASIWANRQLLDTNNWTKTTGKLLADDEVRTALSARLNNALFQEVDLNAELNKRLPKAAQGATPIIAATIQQGAGRAIDAFLSTSQAQQLWQQTNRQAHASLVRVLEGKTRGPVDTNANGDVVLNLGPLVNGVAGRLGLADALAQHTNPGTTQIVILKSKNLRVAKDGVWLLRVLSVALVLVALLLYAIAIYLARGHRRVVLEAVGGSIILVGVLLLALLRIGGNEIVDSYVKIDANKTAGHHVWAIATSLLRDLAITWIVYGALVVIAGLLAGPSRAATWIRRELAPVFHRGPWVVHGIGLVLFLLVLAWGPTPGLREWLGIIVLGGFFFVGLEVWRRQIVRELPPAATVTQPG